MGTATQYLRINDGMTPILRKITDAMNITVSAFEKMNKASKNPISTAELKTARGLIKDVGAEIRKVEEQQDRLNQKVKETGDSFQKFGNIVASIGIGAGIKKLVNLSDELTQIDARLRIMTGSDEISGTKAKIFNAAQNSRSSYTDFSQTVASLGMQAGDAFNSEDETIAFAENLSKMFTTSGLDSSGVSSTMYNLTQSMASGSLLGNDYRILKQNAPEMIAMLEEEYAGGSRVVLDKMVSDGKISAQMLKNVILSNTDEINEKFEKMPMTWSQVWTKLVNNFIIISQPMLNLINNIAQNWNEIEPIVLGVAAAVGLYTGALVIYNVVKSVSAMNEAIHKAHIAMTTVALGAETKATFGATAGQYGFNAALLACPITWVVIAVIALVAVLIYLWNTNDKVAKAMLFAWDSFLIGINVFALGFKGAWYGLLDFLGYFKIGALSIIDNFINNSIGKINDFIELLNKIPGVSIDTISCQSNLATKAATEFAKEKAERDAELADDAQAIYEKAAEMNATRDERVENRTKLNLDTLTSKLLNGNELGTDKLNIGNVDNVSNVEGEVDVSSEDLKLLRELAEQQYIQNYISNDPVLYITTGDINENADVDYLIKGVGKTLKEEIESSMEGVPVG